MSGTEIVYRYDIRSELRADAGQRELALATSGGVTEAGPAVHPRFFSGLLTEPAVAAAGMLAVAAVARASYFTAASVVRLLRDPVVTSNGDRLRFESFSEISQLAGALAPAGADTRIAAAGVWAQASLDGRLDPRLAADAIVIGTGGRAFKLNRIADGLRHAAGQPIAAYRAVEAICRCAPALIEAGEPNLHLLLGLAADMAATVGAPGLPAPLTALARRPSKNRAAAAAALLAEAAAVGPAPDHLEAVAQSLAALVSRTEADLSAVRA